MDNNIGKLFIKDREQEGQALRATQRNGSKRNALGCAIRIGNRFYLTGCFRDLGRQARIAYIT